MFTEDQIGYWMQYHVEPNRIGYDERYTLAIPMRRIGDVPVERLSARHLALYRDQRLQEVGTETVRRELRAIRRALTIARHELDVPLPSLSELYERVRMPEMAPPRERRLSPEEEAALFAAAPEQLQLAMRVALDTGMRRRELCSVTRGLVDLGRGLIRLPREVTKTKRERMVPLTSAAADATARALDLNADHALVFGMTTNALNLAWQRCRKQAAKTVSGCGTFRWHDLRHECLSRLAERGWGVLEIQAVSGHSTPSMLSRYVNLRPDDLVDKLRGVRDA